MLQPRGLRAGPPPIPEGDEGEEGILALPPIPLDVAVRGLMVADHALDRALDKVWELSETELADTIEGTLKSTMESLHEVLRSTEDEDGRRAMARDYLNAAAEMEDYDIEGMELGQLPPLSEAELTKGISVTRSLLQDVGDTLLSFQRDEIEEISDVLLSCSRVGLELLQGATHQALKTLRPEAGQMGEDEMWAGEAGMTGGAVVEEASEEEVAAFYRSRGLEPPVAPVEKEEKMQQVASKSEQPSPSATAAKARHGGRRRITQQRARVLWRPLTPQVVALTKETLPQELRAHPFKTAVVVACVLPFSGVILFCLPGLLVTDHFVLQKVYGRYGAWVEEAVDDIVQVGRLGFVVSRLALRQCYRVARRQFRKAQADPAHAARDAGVSAWDAVTHPLATAKAAFGLGARGVKVAVGMGRFLRDEFVGMRAAQADI